MVVVDTETIRSSTHLAASRKDRVEIGSRYPVPSCGCVSVPLSVVGSAIGPMRELPSGVILGLPLLVGRVIPLEPFVVTVPAKPHRVMHSLASAGFASHVHSP